MNKKKLKVLAVCTNMFALIIFGCIVFFTFQPIGKQTSNKEYEMTYSPLEEDLKVTFNGMTVDENNEESYTKLKVTYNIHHDSIFSYGNYLGFTYDSSVVDTGGLSLDSLSVCSIAAIESDTEKILPITINYEGDTVQVYVGKGDIPPENIEFVFSGCVYDPSCYVLDDFINKQAIIHDSQIARVKLF